MREEVAGVHVAPEGQGDLDLGSSLQCSRPFAWGENAGVILDRLPSSKSTTAQWPPVPRSSERWMYWASIRTFWTSVLPSSAFSTASFAESTNFGDTSEMDIAMESNFLCWVASSIRHAHEGRSTRKGPRGRCVPCNVGVHHLVLGGERLECLHQAERPGSEVAETGWRKRTREENRAMSGNPSPACLELHRAIAQP